MIKRILSLLALMAAALAVAVPLGLCHGHSLLWLFGGGMGLAGAIVATPVETLNNWKDWNIACLDADTAGQFAHGMGLAPDFYTITPGLSFGGSGAAGLSLGTAGAYGVLAGTTITNTGATLITGNLGLSPGSAVTGAPVVTGATNIDNPAAVTAQADLTTAYLAAAALSPSTIATALGGQTLNAGTYSALSGTFTLAAAGVLILDGQGNPNALFVFQMATTLTTGAGSSISLINGAQAQNVIWQVGSSATIGTTTAFFGSILALTSITVSTGATVNGRMLAQNGAVTLAANTITVPGSGGGGGGFGGALSQWGMTVDATNVYLTKQNSAGSGGPASGVSVVAKAFCWRPHTSRR
jgi:hypothetical protein